jgi:hypothetical protein
VLRLPAAANNAAWCDFVCRKHGLEPVFAPDAWSCPARTPDLYPDAVTLAPDVDIDALLSRVDARAGCSLKDSFADLDLEPHGFRVLFEAQWIARPARSEAGDPPSWDVLHLEAVDLCHTGDVVGLANVSAEDWADLVADIDGRCPGAILVGYERGASLEAALAVGFEAVGPLRVWIRC